MWKCNCAVNAFGASPRVHKKTGHSTSARYHINVCKENAKVFQIHLNIKTSLIMGGHHLCKLHNFFTNQYFGLTTAVVGNHGLDMFE